jgi:hypothetical protein
MTRSLLCNFARSALLGAAFMTLAFGASDKKRDRSGSSNAAPAAAASAVSPANSFDAFQLIVERNIFNPNRVGRTRAAPEEKPPRIDEISLVGTMQYDKGLVAFFDSPDSSYRKTLREGESIADFKVQRISANSVELLQGEKPVTLKVTEQLRRPEGADWSVRTTPAAMAATSGSGSMSSGAPSGPTEIPADASEALKRLLEKRNKQLNK